MRNRGALPEQAHRLHQSKLLPPFAQGHSGVNLKQALHRSSACPARLADARKLLAIAWIGYQGRSNSNSPCVGDIRKLEWNHLNLRKFISNDVDQVTLPCNVLFESTGRAGPENQFPQQRRHTHHATPARHGLRQPGPQVERPHRDSSRHRNAVWGPLRYPDSSMRWHNPRAIVGAHGHHATRRVHKLILLMEVQGDFLPSWIVVGVSGNLGFSCYGVKRRALAFFRH